MVRDFSFGGDEITKVHDADDTVEVAPHDRCPGMAQCDELLDSFRDGPVAVEHLDVRARYQDFAKGAMADLEGPRDDGPLLLRERGLRCHEVSKLFLGDSFPGGGSRFVVELPVSRDDYGNLLE